MIGLILFGGQFESIEYLKEELLSFFSGTVRLYGFNASLDECGLFIIQLSRAVTMLLMISYCIR